MHSIHQRKYSPIPRGALLQMVKQQSQMASERGNLRNLPTTLHLHSERALTFQIRILHTLKEKELDRRIQSLLSGSESGRAKRQNPFLPPDPVLTLGSLSPGHLAVLNKYCVVPHHLLVITPRFVHQNTPLLSDDFQILRRCFMEFSGLAFYNGGPEAGASQTHKHLQYIPLPLADNAEVPLSKLFSAAKRSQLPEFPFAHRFSAIEERCDTSLWVDAVYGHYCEMAQELGIFQRSDEKRHRKPYNLLLTSQWMLLVPRVKEHVRDISLNALAFVGAFLVRSETQLRKLKKYGLLNALCAVTEAIE